jgi:hypothetical protein
LLLLLRKTFQQFNNLRSDKETADLDFEQKTFVRAFAAVAVGAVWAAMAVD